MEFKILGIIGLTVFIYYAAKFRNPSLYGWIMALLCIYIPISQKYPFSIAPGVNLINIFFIALFFTKKQIKITQNINDNVSNAGIMWIFVIILASFITILTDGFDNLVNILVNIKRLLDPVLIYYFSKRLVRENDQRTVIDGIAVGVILFSAHLFLQGIDMGDKIRVGGFLGQANAASAFIAAYAPLLSSLLSSTKNVINSLFLTCGLILCGVAQLQTVSRAGIVALGLGVLVTASLSQKKIIKTTAWILALIIIASPALLPEKVLSRFEGNSMSGREGDREAEISMSRRTDIWNASFSMIFANPIGVGLDGFQRHIVNYGGERLDAHNIYLRICGEMGIQGLLVYLCLIFQLVKRGWQGITMQKNNDYAKSLGIALTGSMAAFLVTSMFGTSMLNSLVVNYLSAMAAIVYSSNNREQKINAISHTMKK